MTTTNPTTYAAAAKVAETVTDAEIVDLLAVDTLVYIYPRPRAWQQMGFVQRLTVDNGWRGLEWETPEARDLPRYDGNLSHCELTCSGGAVVIHIPDTGRTIRL